MDWFYTRWTLLGVFVVIFLSVLLNRFLGRREKRKEAEDYEIRRKELIVEFQPLKDIQLSVPSKDQEAYETLGFLSKYKDAVECGKLKEGDILLPGELKTLMAEMFFRMSALVELRGIRNSGSSARISERIIKINELVSESNLDLRMIGTSEDELQSLLLAAKIAEARAALEKFREYVRIIPKASQSLYEDFEKALQSAGIKREDAGWEKNDFDMDEALSKFSRELQELDWLNLPRK